ncbi:MAG: ABC transporter permease, partial [Verrucomicrobiae bacterium]|nr:ABC transporter permease [Verrucomicrobiae bacterium]
MNLVQLTPVDLAIAALLVIALAASSRWLRLGVGRDLLVAATRMGLQLTLIGYVLKALFAQAHWYWIALMALVMLLVAGREILARQQRRLRGGWAFFSGTGAVFVSS